MSNLEFAYALLLQRLNAERNAELVRRRRLREYKDASPSRARLSRLARRQPRSSSDSVEASQSASADCGVLD
jgi:hypothetical protein